MDVPNCYTKKTAFGSGSWLPSETFFFYVAGDHRNTLEIQKLSCCSFFSNGIFVLQAATKVFGIPIENTSLFISGSPELLEKSIHDTKQKLFVQIDQKFLYGTIPNNININFFTEFQQIKVAIKEIVSGHPNSCIYIIFDDHGDKDSFGGMEYTKIYSLFRQIENKALRIFIDGCNSSNFISIIEAQDFLFQNICTITHNRSSYLINNLVFLNELIKTFGLDRVRRMVSLFTKLHEMHLENAVFSMIVFANSIKPIKVHDMLNADPKEKEYIHRFINSTSESFDEHLKRVNINQMEDFCEVINVCLSLLNFKQWYDVINNLNNESLDLLLKLKEMISEEELDSKLRMVKGMILVYPPHQDIKVLTISGSKGYPSIRINQYTKVVAGSPALSAIFNEIFFNFTDQPVCLESIQNEPLIKSYIRKYQSPETSNDRLYLISKNKIDLKVAVTRSLIYGMKHFMENIIGELGFTFPLEIDRGREEDRKMPKEMVDSAFAEYELNMFHLIEATTALSFGESFESHEPILENIPHWMESIVISSLKHCHNRTDAVIFSTKLFTEINQMIDTETQNSIKETPSALFRAAVLEQIEPCTFSELAFKRAISLIDHSEVLKNMMKTKEEVVSIQVDFCIRNQMDKKCCNFDSSNIEENILSNAKEYIRNLARKILTILMNEEVHNIDEIRQLIKSNKDFKATRSFDYIVNCCMNMITEELIGQVGLLLITKELSEHSSISEITPKIFNQVLLRNQIYSIIKCNNIGDALLILEDIIFKNVSLIIKRHLDFLKSNILNTNTYFETFGGISKYAMYELCAKDLINPSIIDVIQSHNEGIDEQTIKAVLDDSISIGMKFHNDAIFGTINQYIPREYADVESLIPHDKNSSLLAAANSINEACSELFCPEFIDSSRVFIDQETIELAALRTVIQLQTGINTTSNHLEEIVNNILCSPKRTNTENNDIHPSIDDILMITGYGNFRLCGHYKTRSREPRKSMGNKIEEEDDDYYSDDSEGIGFRSSGQFLQIDDIRIKLI